MEIKKDNKIVSIEKIKPNDYNPKVDFDSNDDLRKKFNKLKKSLKKHGQVDSLKVREVGDHYELVNGYHRYKAMLELGVKKVEIKNYGQIEKNNAIALALATEDIQFELDEIEVAKLVKELNESDFDLDLLPYDEDEIDIKLKMIDFDWNEFDNEIKVEELETEEKEITCPHCNKKFKI